MKKNNLKSLVKECVKSIINEMELYNPETGEMAPGPRDRTEPSQSSSQSEHRKLSQDFDSGKKVLVLIPEPNGTYKVKLYSTTKEAMLAVKNTPHSVFYISKSISGYYKE